MKIFSGIWGDQCIIFRDQGSTDPPGGPLLYVTPCGKKVCEPATSSCDKKNKHKYKTINFVTMISRSLAFVFVVAFYVPVNSYGHGVMFSSP